MLNALLAASFLLWWFPNSVLIESDATCSLVALLLLWWFLIQFLLKSDAKCSMATLYFSCGSSSCNSYSKLMSNAFLIALLLLWWFLIQVLFKAGDKYSSDCLTSLVVVSYSVLIEK